MVIFIDDRPIKLIPRKNKSSYPPMEDFDVIDVNEVEDLRLAKQNESIKNRF